MKKWQIKLQELAKKEVFQSDNEKQQFMEFIKPALEREINSGDKRKIKKMNYDDFNRLIGYFKFSPSQGMNKFLGDKYFGKHPYWFKFGKLIKENTLLYTLLFFLPSCVVFNFTYLSGFIYYLSCFSVVLLYTLIDAKRGIFGDHREKSRKEFLLREAKKGCIFEASYLISEYAKPISKNFLETKKMESENSRLEDLPSILKNHTRKNNIYANSISILNLANQQKFKDIMLKVKRETEKLTQSEKDDIQASKFIETILQKDEK